MKTGLIAGLLLALNTMLAPAAPAALAQHDTAHGYDTDHARAARPVEHTTRKASSPKGKPHAATATPARKPASKRKQGKGKTGTSKQRCQHSSFCWR
ncbi:hypothetical protein GCM10010970_19340 [Silvimonas iriomotensis]|uniref:Uncharacterized protein n=2 Tax=Silvimonas iriomotensis TaxID=449662 RepID=A0ABQ2P8V3_9NEIS|nr:hypothetical protein GCM10010970_19340 [Silvimonas iriomotensis]